MIIVMSMYLVFAVAIYTGFVASPEEVGLVIQDQAQAVSDKEVEMYQTDLRINPTIVSEIKLEPIVVPTQAAVEEFE